MHWYGGSIAEAVTLSKQKNAIFVVFVEGDNDLSIEMATTIDNQDVVSRLADESKFLAIKLKSGSANYTHFAQIYQFVPVPSLFFIGRNGTPLEVVCAGVEPSNLATRIDRILDEHLQAKQPTTGQSLSSAEPSIAPAQPSTSTHKVKEQTVNMLQAETAMTALTNPKLPRPSPEAETSSGPSPKVQKTEHHEVTKNGQEYDVVCDGDVCVRKPRATAENEAGPSQRGTDLAMDTTPSDDSSTISMEDKLERAKEVIEARRREKAQKEKEEEKAKEIERRTQGQGVAELKRWQAEQELKQVQEERKREKMENNLARQRVLEQIAQDRAERKAREAPPPVQNSASVPTVPVPTSGDGSTRARIQFKLPDGAAHTAHFDADDTLAVVHRYIADNLQLATSSFTVWTAFPRRELTDTTSTLRELQLAPSAALLVMTRRQVAPVARPTQVSSLITFITQLFSSFILEPSQALIAWVRSRLFNTPPPRNSPPPRRQSPTPQRQSPPNVRRRGNVHRLPGDADDDNNTWNGNSTQQM